MKVRAMALAGAAAMAVVGMGLSPALAEKPADGTAGGGNAMAKAQPKGQVVPGWYTDKNKGFRCDWNPGVGDGNPAFAACDDEEGPR